MTSGEAMRRAVVLAAVAMVAAACTGLAAEREMLLRTQGVPVTAVTSADRTCVEIGEGGRHGQWCTSDDEPEEVWLGSAAIGDTAVIVGQGPADVVEVILTTEDRTRLLVPQESDLGLFFVGLDVPTGRYEVEARTGDGSAYAVGELTLRQDGVTLVRMAP